MNDGTRLACAILMPKSDAEPISRDPPISFTASPPVRGHRWKIIALVVGCAVALVVGGLIAHAGTKRDTARKLAALQGQWAALQGCLLGAPLSEDETLPETPASRFRAVQLTVVGIPRGARATAHEAAWPVRCTSFASGVADGAGEAPTNAIELKTSALALGHALLADVNATDDLEKLVTLVWKDAATAGLVATPANPGDAPPPTRAALSSDTLRASTGFQGDFALASVKPDPAPTANTRFLIDDRMLERGPVTCSVSGVPTTLACMPVGPGPSGGLALLGTTDVAAYPWIFAGDRGQLGVYRPSGALAFLGQPVVGAAVGPDGSAWLLVHPVDGGPSDVRLVSAPVTGDVSPGLPVLARDEISQPEDATLIWSWLVLRAGPHAQFPHHLVAHAMLGNGAVGPALDIGDAVGVDDARPPTQGGQPRFSACRSGNNIAVRVNGGHADAMAFFTGVTWTPPVVLMTRGGDLICEGNEAIVTASKATSDGSPEVEQSRCNATGCTTSHLAMRDLLAGTDVAPLRKDGFVATELEGKLLLVWNSGPLGGLRMRLAPRDLLSATADTVLYDTRDEKGQSAITDLRLLSSPDVAILFVKTVSGSRILGIDHAGSPLALRTKT
jgi:hypothetical protein